MALVVGYWLPASGLLDACQWAQGEGIGDEAMGGPTELMCCGELGVGGRGGGLLQPLVSMLATIKSFVMS